MASITEEHQGTIDTKIAILEAVAKLPKKQRVVIALTFAGFRQRECSAIVGIHRAAVGKLLKSAKLSLKELLGELENVQLDP